MKFESISDNFKCKPIIYYKTFTIRSIKTVRFFIYINSET